MQHLSFWTNSYGIYGGNIVRLGVYIYEYCLDDGVDPEILRDLISGTVLIMAEMSSEDMDKLIGQPTYMAAVMECLRSRGWVVFRSSRAYA